MQLPGSFDDYFNSDGTPMGGYFQACFTAGDGLINYNNFDTLLCVSQSDAGPADADPPGRTRRSATGGLTQPPRATRTTASSRCPTSGARPTTARSARRFSHELGHNLGLGDQYTPSVAGRNPGGWEMMDSMTRFRTSAFPPPGARLGAGRLGAVIQFPGDGSAGRSNSRRWRRSKRRAAGNPEDWHRDSLRQRLELLLRVP